jgi:signal transduction histidine kinase
LQRRAAAIRRQNGGWQIVIHDNPEAAPLNPLPPPVQIETVKIDNAEADARGEIRVRPGQANLEIGYIGLSFIKPEQMRFRYKLIGQDQDWIEAGARRTANYSYLPPGRYTFNVIAANSDGVWNEAGASLRVVIVPPFYRTWWFLGLTGLSLGGLVMLIYRLRVAQLRKEHAVKEAFSRQLLESQEAFSRRLIESQESERKRIAGELHDGLGQSLVIIKNRALHSLTEPGDLDLAMEQIEEIADAATHAILEAREIAYNLRPFHIDRLGLTTAIGAMARRAGNDSLRFTTELDSIDGLLAPEQEINFYRIVQECLNNIIKHSEASQASVTIKRHDQMIELTIQDNGRGFTPGVRQESANGSGFGLLGLNERARILGGMLTVTSAPGHGTITNLKLHLSSLSSL